MGDGHTALISTITVGLVLAFVLGLLAHRLRIPPLAGYLLAGIAIGPHTPGFVADADLAAQLSEIGIVLLMFGVGLHFSPADLARVAAVALPAALIQIGLLGGLGAGLALLMGWDPAAGLIFGLALAVASTVVQVRALQERRLLETQRGRLSVGWLVAEDLVTVLVLVLLPLWAAGGAGALNAGVLTIGKVLAFIGLMYFGGRRLIPAVLHHTAHTGSRELFRLSVFGTALGVALLAATVFDASFALGAFCAGIVLGESKLSQRAADEALPLRDAFAVLFFVSVGMLFNPGAVLEHPAALAGSLALIVVVKPVTAFLILRLFRRSVPQALTVAAGRAQIGEFSFILIGAALTLGLVPALARDLVLSAAILSILINPLLFEGAERWLARHHPPQPEHPPVPHESPEPEPEAEAEAEAPVLDITGHALVAGYGRVGRRVAEALTRAGERPVVIDLDGEALAEAQAAGALTLTGNAADPALLRRANLAGARRVFVTLPEAFEAGQVVEQARAAAPEAVIYARAHSDEDEEHLNRLGASLTVMGEREIADRMVAADAAGDPAKA